LMNLSGGISLKILITNLKVYEFLFLDTDPPAIARHERAGEHRLSTFLK